LEPERWRKIEHLYQAAVKLDPPIRDDYLKDACGGDDSLRSEVEELIALDSRAGGFIETPALHLLARQEARALETSSGFRLEPGARLGPYEILNALGAGGMGEVYSAHDVRLGRTVAVKILNPRMMDQAGFRERLEGEARAISSLNHPPICTIHDIGRDGDIDFIVMEHLEGQTLAQHLKTARIPYQDLLRIAIEISRAIDYAHARGVIHRDLKPGNIMLTANGAKLVDFGLARWRAEIGERGSGAGVAPSRNVALTMTGSVIGTPQYMAPEQIERRDVDGRADIFALGAVIFEMATGRRAFERTVGEIASAGRSIDPPDIRSLRPEIPTALQALVCRCLMKSPQQRWQSAGDLVQELTQIQQQSAPQYAVRATSSFNRRMAAGAVLLILAAGVAVRTMNRHATAIADHVLYSFTGMDGDGATPTAGVVAGKNGTLYGITHDGGISGKGTIFELRPAASAGLPWTQVTLYSFKGGRDGSHPFASLSVGGGLLYGTTGEGGAYGKGTVFELRPPAGPSGNWTERVLYHFSGKNGDGASPRPDLLIGKNGEIYGTASEGGSQTGNGGGIVFELIPPDTPGGAWIERVLHRFTGHNGDGAFPYSGLVIGDDGAIYGTTFGGPAGTGTVFKLTPGATKDSDWSEAVLHRFVGRDQNGDGASPVAGLVIGRGRALYGTTQWGGIAGNGTVFELKPPEASGGEWTYAVLHRFTSHVGDGAEPTAGLVAGNDGALYGATLKGGTWGQGTVFKLMPSKGSWTEAVLYSFTGHDGDGARPGCVGHLSFDGSALYGTTEVGGVSNAGTVFKLPL
jgi:uncharacterized repeat protein (TIGR03803 family)